MMKLEHTACVFIAQLNQVPLNHNVHALCLCSAEEVRVTFPSAALSDIHQTMQQKLSNAVKSLKRSCSKVKSTTNDEIA
jgi:hypothetical protein